MYCPECSSKINDRDNFCGMCGAGLPQPVSKVFEKFEEDRLTVFKIKNEISGEEETVKVNKDTFEQPILIGSGAQCDVVLKSTGDSVISEQHALLGHIGHHTYLRTKRDEYGKIPAAVNEYGHLVRGEEGDRRLGSDDDEPGYKFRIGHYSIHMGWKMMR